jgi:hypothetical protein
MMRPESMKFSPLTLATLTLAMSALVRPAGAATHSLAIEFGPRWNGAPLAFDALDHTNAAGQRVSVTRLDFLLSNFALRRTDGAWLPRTNWFAYVSGREGRRRRITPRRRRSCPDIH